MLTSFSLALLLVLFQHDNSTTTGDDCVAFVACDQVGLLSQAYWRFSGLHGLHDLSGETGVFQLRD